MVGHLLFVTSNLRLGLGLLLDFGRTFGVGTLSRNKEAYVADLMKFPNSILFWYLNFRRCSEDGKLESFYNLMSRIYGASLRGVRDDKMCWKPAMGRGFTVRSYY